MFEITVLQVAVLFLQLKNSNPAIHFGVVVGPLQLPGLLFVASSGNRSENSFLPL